MDNVKFAKLAEHTILLIADTIETEDKNCLIDVDLHGDILILTTDQGIFIINKHSVAQEIWISSPISGPYHFGYIAGRWQSKSSDDLIDILVQELKINFDIYRKLI